MKNAKLITIIACLVAVVLLAASFIFGFERSVESDWTNVMSVELNEKFDSKVVEDIMKEAGAVEFIVLKTSSGQDISLGTGFQVYFKTADGVTAKEVFNKAESLLAEKFTFKYPGTISEYSASVNTKTFADLWPVLIVFVVLLAYVFIRFEIKTAVATLLHTFIVCAATVGVISIASIKLSGFIAPALFLVSAVALASGLILCILNRENAIKAEKASCALAQSIKQTSIASIIMGAVLAVAFVIMLILGGVAIKGFALAALIGVAVNTFAAIFVMPALVNSFGKEN